jgi:serine/threonine-protein kinase
VEDVERATAALPPALQAVLVQALRREPEARHATAAALRDALRACLAQEERAAGQAYGRKELAAELERVISEASARRDEVEVDDEGLFPDGLEEHELVGLEDSDD